MILSTTFTQSLDRLFYDFSPRNNFSTVTLYDKSYFNNTLFDKFLHVDLRQSHIEIPLFCKEYVEDILSDRLRGLNSIEELNITLFSRDNWTPYKTSNSIFKLIASTFSDTRLRSFQTSNGQRYYGGRGIILDESKSPIFFITIEGDITDEGIKESNIRIYLAPSVTTSSFTLEKAIFRRVVPYYLSYGCYTSSYRINVINAFTRCVGLNVLPEVIITDFSDKFFVTASKAYEAGYKDEDINKFLSNHTNLISDIIFGNLKQE